MVVKADTHTPLLFGRSWLQAIQLDRSKFSSGWDNLKAKYADILKQELGTVKDIKAALYIKENIKPVFLQVAFALRPAVERVG